MKKLAAALLTVLLISTLSACSQPDRIKVDGMTGIGIYTEFIGRLESGTLQKNHYSFHSWFDFITSESTVIKFNTMPDGRRELLYRDRNPFVIWDYPPYDYYDGTNYYYKYKSDWFEDHFSKYDRVQQQDFIGIRENFFTGNNILSDTVYRLPRGYLLETTVQSVDRVSYYTLEGNTDKNFNFSSIKILEYTYNFDKSEYENTSVYRFRYSDINKGKPIVAPKDLALADKQTARRDP